MIGCHQVGSACPVVRATRGAFALFIIYMLPVVVGVPVVESYRRIDDRVDMNPGQFCLDTSKIFVLKPGFERLWLIYSLIIVDPDCSSGYSPIGYFKCANAKFAGLAHILGQL